MGDKKKKPPQYIYFLTGFLYPDEIPAMKSYFQDTKSIYKAEAPGFYLNISWDIHKPYHFVPVHQCSPGMFKEIWKDNDTAGIFWYSHGDPTTGNIWGNHAIHRKSPDHIDVRKLPKSGKNLKFISVLSCGSEVARQEWFKKMSYRKAVVKTIRGNLVDGSMKKGDPTYDFFNATDQFVPEDPTVGARYMMQYAMGTHKPGESGACNCTMAYRTTSKLSYPNQMISFDRFKPDHVFVPYRRIPKVGTEASHYVTHQIRKGDRVYYLAEDYGYSNRKRFTEDVEKLNPGINFGKLMPGQRINVPTKVGVPRTISPPYALTRRNQIRTRTVKPSVRSVLSSTLNVLKKTLAKTHLTASRETSPPFNTHDALKRLENQVNAQRKTQQWLQGLQARYGGMQHPTGGMTKSPLKRLNEHLTRTQNTVSRRHMPTFDTMSTLEHIEQQARDGMNRQRWLDRIQQRYGPQCTGLSPIGRSQSLLNGLNQHMVQTTGISTRRPTPTFDTMNTLRQIERRAAEQQRTQQWLNRLQQQYR